jgi:hypothetical protein
MNCQECLSELATGSLRDLTPESEVMRHCSTCPDCGPLATVLRDREYTAATILNSLPPISNPLSVAETAALISHRRRIGKVVVFLSGAGLVATIFASLLVTDLGRNMIGADKPNLLTETIPLTCLSPEQAGDIDDPYLRTRGSIYYIGKSGIPAITVRGTAAQVAKSKQLIRAFEGDPQAACRHSPFEKVDEILKRYGGPPPDPNAAPVLAPSPEAAPPAKKK